MSFKGLILTNNGRNELAKAEAGEIFQIESIALGDGQYDGAYTDMEAMANQVMLIPSAKITRKENEVYVDVEFSSQDVPKAFYFREIGIIANSKLCFYDNCGQDAEYIDPESNNFIKQKRLRMILCISSDALVNVQIRSQLYALEEDLQLHTGKKDNPHDVTKAQIGLGNADNTADVDKPVSTAQGQAIKEVYEQSAGYTDKKVGELINGAPSTLDTLKEIADAMAENETVVSALNDAIGTKANQAEMENSIKTIQADLSQKLSVSGDASSTTVTFAEAGAMAELTGGETMNNLFGKLKLTVKNMLAVLKLLGKTDISAIGDGTVTGAIGALNSNLSISMLGDVVIAMPGVSTKIASYILYTYYTRQLYFTIRVENLPQGIFTQIAYIQKDSILLPRASFAREISVNGISSVLKIEVSGEIYVNPLSSPLSLAVLTTNEIYI